MQRLDSFNSLQKCTRLWWGNFKKFNHPNACATFESPSKKNAHMCTQKRDKTEVQCANEMSIRGAGKICFWTFILVMLPLRKLVTGVSIPPGGGKGKKRWGAVWPSHVKLFLAFAS